MQCTSPMRRYVSSVPLKGFRETSSGYDRLCGPTEIVLDPLARFDSLVPCGQCMACRVNKTQEWTFRLWQEQQYSSDTLFLTLTYDDHFLRKTHEDGLPLDFACDVDLNLDFPGVMVDSTGEVTYATFWKKDLKEYMWRFRSDLARHDQDKIRFFASGEYGEITNRPHFHMILFNAPPRIRKEGYLWKLKPYPVYHSQYLTDLWRLGQVTYGEAVPQSLAYVARYVQKKLTGETLSALGSAAPLQPWCVMSRRPGIGKAYCLDNVDKLAEFQEIFMIKGDSPVIRSLPRTYLTWLDHTLDDEARLNLHARRDAKKADLLARQNEAARSLNFDDELERLRFEQRQREAVADAIKHRPRRLAYSVDIPLHH